jgi:hypothetical protein
LKKLIKSMISIGFAVGMATVANAQATRTWVSGVGDDVNPCSRTAPCKTFAGAISKTANKGEIDALDPGGFGAVTITKSITLDGAGTMASILFSGTNGVNVNDSATGTPNTIEVTLRNLSLNGGGTGLDGVRFVSGKRLTIDKCDIFNGTGDGVEVLTTAANLQFEMRNSTVENMGQGLNIHPISTGFTAVISNTHIFRMTGLPGIDFNGALFAIVSDSDVSNASSAGIQIRSTANVQLDRVRALGSPFGVFNQGGTPTTRLKDCVLTGTSVGAQNNAGTMTAFSSNVIVGTGGVVTTVAPQ